MLFITRRVGQSLMIGDQIELIVEDVRGRTVKLGIRHPAGVSVLRRELFERIREENIRAADVPLDDDGLADQSPQSGRESGPADRKSSSGG